MQLVEQHIIKKADKRFKETDKKSFASKNLYNYANYLIRQEFFDYSNILNYIEIYDLVKNHETYKALPAKVSQSILRQLEQNWKSFIEAMKAYNERPSEFRGRPKPPGYKHKTKGRNSLIYTIQAISKRELKKGFIKPSGLDIKVKTFQRNINQVRILPGCKFYTVEVVYTIKEKELKPDNGLIGGIDMGLNNLVALTSNKPGFIPAIVNGRPLKSINQYYNKKKSYLQSLLPENTYNSNRISRLTIKRNRRIKHYMHNASKQVVELLETEGINTLIIGQNKGWKQEINIGKKNNQNFVSIPHSQLIDMISYKAGKVGISVITTEESYTSKCSFLDNETIEKHEKYTGKRKTRGLFISGNGIKINADINGAGNVIRKVVPDAFSEGIEDFVVHPLALKAING